MDKPWLNAYPNGVPEHAEVTTFDSVAEIFEKAVDKYANLPAFRNFGITLSYADMERHSRALAAYLQSNLGLQKGDRVAIMMPNLLQNAIAIFAVLRAGLTVVNTNPMYTARELKHQLSDSGANTIIILENFAHVLEQVIVDTQVNNVIVTRMGDMLGFPKGAVVNAVVKYVKKIVPPFSLPGAIPFRAALVSGAGREMQKADIGLEDIALLQYTGGTTGEAKGAVLTNGNLVANILQMDAWLSGYYSEGKEIIITALPLYHIFSLTVNCLLYTHFGALNLLITNPRDMAGFVKELKGVPFTTFTGVNTLFNGLLNTPGFADLDFSRFRFSAGGGMAVQRVVAERWKEVTGSVLREGYGLTETSAVVCFYPLTLEEYNGSIGLPIPSTEVSIMDSNGNRLPAGQDGELCIRGPQVMRGYWQRPEATAEAISPEGWFHSGDIAEMDEQGYFRIIDRKKDMILVSGFNVYPSEIEAVVAEHPGVLESGAIGVPDEHSGEVVKVVVVRKDPNLTAENLIAFCRENMTSYKVPKIVEFRDDLPKTNVGKILRRALRDE